MKYNNVNEPETARSFLPPIHDHSLRPSQMNQISPLSGGAAASEDDSMTMLRNENNLAEKDASNIIPNSDAKLAEPELNQSER